MKKTRIIFVLLFAISLLIQCETKPERTSKEPPFIALLKLNSEKLNQSYDINQNIDQANVLDVLLVGNGLLAKEQSKDKAKERNYNESDGEKEQKAEQDTQKYPHPVNFNSLIDLYYIDQKGTYHYNSKDKKLDSVKEANILNELTIATELGYQANSYILVNLHPSKEKLYQGIDRLKEKYNKDILDSLKEAYQSEAKIRRSALIEAGTAVKNMMLVLSSLQFTHYPISLEQKQISKLKNLGLATPGQEPFMLIPLGLAKDSSKDQYLNGYVNKLIESSGNAKVGDFNVKSPVSQEELAALVWAGNGIITDKGQKVSTHSILPNSLINLYYINHQRVDKYDVVSNSFETIKFGDFRHRLGAIVEKYKAPEAILVTIKTSSNDSDYHAEGKSAKGAGLYNSILKKQSVDLSLFEVGMALQNIRLLATDLNLAYQHIEVPSLEGTQMIDALSLQKDDTPVFIIPIGKKAADNK